jgi:hypothetical protein
MSTTSIRNMEKDIVSSYLAPMAQKAVEENEIFSAAAEASNWKAHFASAAKFHNGGEGKQTGFL